jgi:hypothetical protein
MSYTYIGSRVPLSCEMQRFPIMANCATALQPKGLEGLYLNMKYVSPADMFFRPAMFIRHSWIELLWLLSFSKHLSTLSKFLLFILLYTLLTTMPITVAARSKTWTAFARSNAEIVGSNPIPGLVVVRVYSVFVLFCIQIEALRRADPQSKESYRLCIGLRIWKAAKDKLRTLKPLIDIYGDDLILESCIIYLRRRDSSVDIATLYGLDNRG